MRKMDRREQERNERDATNFETQVQNALRLYYSYEDGSTYVECEGGVGYENYLVEVSNPGDMAGHKPECLYADTDADFGMEKALAHAKECQAASLYQDYEIPVVETDRKALAKLLKKLCDESEYATMKEFVEHYLPENLQSYNCDVEELENDAK